MALSGALVAFHGLSAWWSIVTAMLVTATITFLMLASWTDPGYMQKYSDRDPLIDILFERARPVLQNTRSLRVSVEYQGDTYHRFLHDGSWVREEPGECMHSADAESSAGDETPGPRYLRGRFRKHPCKFPPLQSLQSVTLPNCFAGLRRGHRYCGSCHIWRPPHAHHCQHCQRCVQNFDHHCDVLHICVGGLNHRWFTLFLLSALAGALVLCGGGARTIFLLGFHHRAFSLEVYCYHIHML